TLFISDTEPTPIFTLSYTTLFRSRAVEEVARVELQRGLGGVQLHRAARRRVFQPRGQAQGADGGVVEDPVVVVAARDRELRVRLDRKSTRLNSSHDQISYAVFCLK